MFAIKRELKLNNKERSLICGIAGFKRFVYNYGLDLITASWDFKDVQGGDPKRIDAIKKVFTNVTMKKPEYARMKKYPSTVDQSAFIALKKSFDNWRKGLTGFPNKKSKKKGDSFTVYKTSGIYPEKGKPALPFTNRVNPAYTSQECSCCGTIVKKSLSTRTHICLFGFVLDRDPNAAINILKVALSTQGIPELGSLIRSRSVPEALRFRRFGLYFDWSNPVRAS